MELKKIKLNKLANRSLAEREIKGLKGGAKDGSCFCGCKYAHKGGSSTQDNMIANSDRGLYSSGCDHGIHVPPPVIIYLH